jgi:beta-glucanase (GH16 family)
VILRWAVGLALAALAVGVVSGCGGPTEPADPDRSAEATPSAEAGSQPPESPRSGLVTWKLAWSDEFDAPAGTPPDPANWGYDLGDGSVRGLEGWGNREREYYTDSAANAATDGEGNLLITARVADGSLECWYGPCEYTSARLLTKGRHEIQYGRIEVRLKVPRGAGFWPAVWMLGANLDEIGWPKSGEIDVMEHLGRLPTEILGTIHGPGYSGSSGFSGTLDLGTPVDEDFHTVAIEWRPGHIAWFVDGVVYHEAGPADVAPNEWVFDRPFFLLLNVAVGGNLAGPVALDTVFPQAMAVDYVRLYEETTP